MDTQENQKHFKEGTIIGQMRARGYSLCSIGCKRDGTHETMCFLSSDVDSAILNVKVYISNEEYEINYMVPNSMNLLTTPRSGSLYDDEEFNGIETKIKEQAKLLHSQYAKNVHQAISLITSSK